MNSVVAVVALFALNLMWTRLMAKGWDLSVK
jgi:hypothetical protein